MISMNGTAPIHICALLSTARTGTVEMVNSRGIYIELANRRILLCGSDFGTVPNGIVLDKWSILPTLLQVGQPVRTGGGLLRFPFGKVHLHLQAVPNDTAVSVPPQKGLKAALALLEQNPGTGLAALARPLFGKPPLPLDLLCETALPRIEGLLAALEAHEPSRIELYTKNLLGFGLGLTPSGDDVLAGLMYGLRHSPQRETPGVVTLTTCIQALAMQRTNAVSADYLTALANDAPFERLAQTWRDPIAGAPALLKIGSNSGGEMLLGLLLAARKDV